MSPRKQALTVALAVIISIAVCFGVYGIRQVFAERTAYGTCNQLLSTCRDVPMETLELVAGYQWTATRKSVVESEATLPSRISTGGVEYVEGVIKLEGAGPGVSTGEGASQPSSDDNANATAAGQQALRWLGASDLHIVRSRDDLVVMQGTAGAATLVYVYAILDK